MFAKAEVIFDALRKTIYHFENGYHSVGDKQLATILAYTHRVNDGSVIQDNATSTKL